MSFCIGGGDGGDDNEQHVFNAKYVSTLNQKIGGFFCAEISFDINRSAVDWR